MFLTSAWQGSTQQQAYFTQGRRRGQNQWFHQIFTVFFITFSTSASSATAGAESRDPGTPPEPGGSRGQICADGAGKHQGTGTGGDLVELGEGAGAGAVGWVGEIWMK